MVKDSYLTNFNKLMLGGSFNNSRQRENKRDGRRKFTQTQRKEILYQQNNKCSRCHKMLDPRDIHYHHEKPWASGGRTITTNGRALCGSCHNIIGHEANLKKVNKKRPERSTNYFGSSVYKPQKFKPSKFDLF